MRIYAMGDVDPGTEVTLRYVAQDRHAQHIGRIIVHWPDLHTLEQAAQAMLAYVERTRRESPHARILADRRAREAA